LRSSACTTEVVAVRAPAGNVALTCGGHPLFPAGTDPLPSFALDPSFSGGTLIGKRYVDEAGTIELLCAKGGEGSLALDGQFLAPRAAKPLPSSD
jgi:hypothetical protein